MLVIATLVGVFVAWWNSSKNFKILNKDVNAKLRPWIVRNNKITMVITTEAIVFKLTNVGRIEAKNVRIQDFCILNEPSKDPFPENPQHPNFSVAPTETFDHTIPVNNSFLLSESDEKIIYFGILIKYNDKEKNEYYYKFKGKITVGEIKKINGRFYFVSIDMN